MKTRFTFAFVTILSISVARFASPQAIVPEAELDYLVPYFINHERVQFKTLRELRERQGYATGLPVAYAMHDWLRERFTEQLIPKPNSSGATWQIVNIEENEVAKVIMFSFRDQSSVVVSSLTGRIISIGNSMSYDARNRIKQSTSGPVSDDVLSSIATELANRSGARIAGLDYITRFFPRDGDDSSVSYLGCLRGTEYPLGPGVSGNFDKYSGLPIHVQFSYETWPYEAPFRDVIGEEEGYALALPLAFERVPWPAFRLITTDPVFQIPNFRALQITRSPRHDALIAENRRCLVTTVLAAPVTAGGSITEWVTFAYDSQTRELLSVRVQPPGEFGTSAKRLNEVLSHSQMVALPNLQLKMPLNSVKDAGPMPADGLTKVIVRQGKFFFNAQLDPKQRVIWIEGRPYQATRAFTEKLLKLLPRSAL